MPVCPNCDHSFDYGESAEGPAKWDGKTENPGGDQTTLAESVGGGQPSEGPDVPRLDDLTLGDGPRFEDELDEKLDEEKPDVGDFINPADPAKW